MGVDLGAMLRRVSGPLLAGLDRGAMDRLFLVPSGVPRPSLLIRAQKEGCSAEEIEARLGVMLAPAGPVASLSYLPEEGRYGGRRGIALAEQVFYLSTVALLRAATVRDLESEAKRARAAMVAALTFGVSYLETRERGARFFARWLVRWLSPEAQALPCGEAQQRLNKVVERAERQGSKIIEHLPRLWEQALQGDQEGWSAWLLDSLVLSRAAHREAFLQGDLDLEHFENISLPSYLHMSNRRHGLLRVDELYQSYLLAVGLGGKEQIDEELRLNYREQGREP